MPVQLSPIITPFFHHDSSTFSYVVSCPQTSDCAIIDPVLDFDLFSGNVDCLHAKKITHYIEQQALTVRWILETHAHADHASAASYLKAKLGGNIACSREITVVQHTFKKFFNLTDVADNGEQFDQLLVDGDHLPLGQLNIEVMATPGHTPDSVCYLIGDNAFIGDTLFMPDSGTARCDFPAGSAEQLYQSIQKIYTLGDQITLFMCHDYQPEQRELRYHCSVAEQKAHNIHLSGKISAAEYIAMREQRDKGLDVPRLLYPALQFNIRAGALPEAESNQQYYLKIPLSGLEKLKS